MQFIPNNQFKEVSLKDGLRMLFRKQANKLYSTGLDDYEYIYYDKGFYYEDHAFLGNSVLETLELLQSLEWVYNHKFYIERTADNETTC